MGACGGGVDLFGSGCLLWVSNRLALLVYGHQILLDQWRVPSREIIFKLSLLLLHEVVVELSVTIVVLGDLPADDLI